MCTFQFTETDYQSVIFIETMNKHEDKQQQRKQINEAIKDYLARGGTITKIDMNQVEPDYNAIGQTDEFDQFADFQMSETSNLLSVRTGTKITDF